MKKKIFTVTFLLLHTISFSQKLISRESDVKKIEENKDLFIGKPLSFLLNEIGPAIKRVMANPSVNNNSHVGNFRFNFMDEAKIKKVRNKGLAPITLVVFVKENFEWDLQSRVKDKETVWTNEDIKKYGNLTIVGFRTYGNIESDQVK